MSKLCPESKKRMFRSAAAARRSSTQRYGVTSNVYRCWRCKRWHVTRRDVPLVDEDPQLEQLHAVLLGPGESP